VGSNVRTGSHNVFVAPVRIGDGAYTGAGTTVRKDVPAGSLAISYAPQRNTDGWVEEHRPGTPAASGAAKASAYRVSPSRSRLISGMTVVIARFWKAATAPCRAARSSTCSATASPPSASRGVLRTCCSSCGDDGRPTRST
ncbi:hypothetical protein IAE22_27730, partial [Bacillus sp. S34]|nr:hypothetical protein [Bacillus sp. S34]